MGGRSIFVISCTLSVRLSVLLHTETTHVCTMVRVKLRHGREYIIHGSTANSHHQGLVTLALISSFMVTKQTFELSVIWEAGVLGTSLWLRNCRWIIIHWILWPLIFKPQQCNFRNFGYNVTNITHSEAHENKSDDLPVRHYQTWRINSKVIHLTICSKFWANHFRNIELIIKHLFPNSWINTTLNCLW